MGKVNVHSLPFWVIAVNIASSYLFCRVYFESSAGAPFAPFAPCVTVFAAAVTIAVAVAAVAL